MYQPRCVARVVGWCGVLEGPESRVCCSQPQLYGAQLHRTGGRSLSPLSSPHDVVSCPWMGVRRRRSGGNVGTRTPGLKPLESTRLLKPAAAACRHPPTAAPHRVARCKRRSRLTGTLVCTCMGAWHAQACSIDAAWCTPSPAFVARAGTRTFWAEMASAQSDGVCTWVRSSGRHRW